MNLLKLRIRQDCTGDDLGTAHTWLQIRQPGIPRSRANDQNWRDAEANMPTEVVIPIVVTIELITAVPGTDPVACKKIAIKG